jgi:hypothetical protein
MGASYSFVFCGVLGGALSYPENANNPVLASPVWNLLDSWSYPERLRGFGVLGALGMILFLIFYSSCHWSLDYCGFLGVTSRTNWILAMMSGALLGFSGVGLVYTYLRRFDDVGGGPLMYGNSGYNPAPSQPSISMI